MKRFAIAFLVITTVCFVFVGSGCKTSDTVVQLFSIATTTGYSKKVTTVDPDDTGLTSINLFAAVRSNGDTAGTITGWVFKIRHNVVTLVEINSSNYQNFNLVTSGDMVIPANEIKEFYVNTPPPFGQNALTAAQLSFDPYIPTEVVVEIQVTADNGEVYSITGAGGYTFEQGVINESKYDIVGDWEFKRVVNGAEKAKQKMVFVGTKMNGKYVLYKFGSDEVDESGSYMVSNYKYLTFTSDLGAQYWGEFGDETHMNGTLMIPASGKESSKTGTWTGRKL